MFVIRERLYAHPVDSTEKYSEKAEFPDWILCKLYTFFSQFMSELIKRQYLLLEKKFVCFNGNVLFTTYYFSFPEDSEQFIKMICVLCKVSLFYCFLHSHNKLGLQWNKIPMTGRLYYSFMCWKLDMSYECGTWSFTLPKEYRL